MVVTSLHGKNYIMEWRTLPKLRTSKESPSWVHLVMANLSYRVIPMLAFWPSLGDVCVVMETVVMTVWLPGSDRKIGVQKSRGSCTVVVHSIEQIDASSPPLYSPCCCRRSALVFAIIGFLGVELYRHSWTLSMYFSHAQYAWTKVWPCGFLNHVSECCQFSCKRN